MPSAFALLALAALAVVALMGQDASASGLSLDLGGSDEDMSFYQWDSLIKHYAQIYGVPWRWIKAVCLIESDLGRNPRVAKGLQNPHDVEASKSSDGLSWGLMQVTLPTARGLAGRTISAEELNNPDTCMDLGVHLLSQNIARFGLDDRESVIRAYNGGPRFGAATVPYYNKFTAALARIQKTQPGDEMEV